MSNERYYLFDASNAFCTYVIISRTEAVSMP
jgi:hypothetical protein